MQDVPVYSANTPPAPVSVRAEVSPSTSRVPDMFRFVVVACDVVESVNTAVLAVLAPIGVLSIVPPEIVKSLSTSALETTDDPETKSEAVRVSEILVLVMQEVQVRVSPPASTASPLTYKEVEVALVEVAFSILILRNVEEAVVEVAMNPAATNGLYSTPELAPASVPHENTPFTLAFTSQLAELSKDTVKLEVEAF